MRGAAKGTEPDKLDAPALLAQLDFASLAAVEPSLGATEDERALRIEARPGEVLRQRHVDHDAARRARVAQHQQ